MKIGIADSQARVRFGLRTLLEQRPGWSVIGEADDSQELLAFVRENCPDVVLIDWDLPGIPAETLLRILHSQYPSLLILSMSGRQEVSLAALKAGADSFASKMDPPEKLLNRIRELHAQKGQSSVG